MHTAHDRLVLSVVDQSALVTLIARLTDLGIRIEQITARCFETSGPSSHNTLSTSPSSAAARRKIRGHDTSPLTCSG
jgi:hypothetical protein